MTIIVSIPEYPREMIGGLGTHVQPIRISNFHARYQDAEQAFLDIVFKITGDEVSICVARP